MKVSWIVGAAFFLLSMWIAWSAQSWIVGVLGLSWNQEALGQWGDSFGALNALFSAFAFIAVLVTLRQQRADLANQQKQISQDRHDQHMQQFETTFYELLRLLREARDAVEFRHSDEYEIYRVEIRGDSRASALTKGTEAFKQANFEMLFWIKRAEAQNNGPLTAEILADLYTKHIHNRFESSLAPYYRILYTHLMRIKDDAFLSQDQKNGYGNLLRSQLTSHEVALCCYDGLAPFSGSLRSLIIEFRMAKYLSDEFGRRYLNDIYPETTFLGRN
ncbi:hypothetical protein FP026_07865 [Rhizobium tropici]|uniref:Phage abortive infection protein n=1 Tax=Rhizobium tropici TaxID=398 RepID=A0A5B0WAJ6_RHITR|nr:putative phage abortive infection protein [Rhizobium tropici]KAA1183926.1 hypothetical protein FP026_07865 [Rhizobium tropici]